jgi:hypothetical protein
MHFYRFSMGFDGLDGKLQVSGDVMPVHAQAKEVENLTRPGSQPGRIDFQPVAEI